MSVRLSYRSQGTPGAGAPLVILHGLLGSSSNWRSIARRLADSHRVYVVDLRNHGDSPHAATMSYPEMADDVLTFLDDRAIERAVLIGHSMGGKTAMRLALTAPERIERLVVVDIAPTRSEHDHLPVLSAMSALDLGRIERRADADRLLAAHIPDSEMRMFVLQNLTSGAQGFAWRINLPAIADAIPALLDFPVDADTRPFTGDTLFVRGARSDYVGARDEAAIKRLFPNAEIVTIADAGHWVHAEQPARFLAALGLR